MSRRSIVLLVAGATVLIALIVIGFALWSGHGEVAAVAFAGGGAAVSAAITAASNSRSKVDLATADEALKAVDRVDDLDAIRTEVSKKTGRQLAAEIDDVSEPRLR